MINEKLLNRFDLGEMGEKVESMKAEIGFPEIKTSPNVITIINNLSDIGFIQKLHPTTISEYSVLLSTYSLYLTTQENKFKAYVNWCEANLQHLVGTLIGEAPGYGFEEKNQVIRSNYDKAKELEEQKLIAVTRLEVIRNTSIKLEFICNTLRNLYFEKAKAGKRYE